MFILLSFLSSEVRANTQLFNKISSEYSSEYLNEHAITDNSLETNASDEQQDISQDTTEEAEEISNQTSSNEPQFIHTPLWKMGCVSIYSNPNFSYCINTNLGCCWKCTRKFRGERFCSFV